MIYQLKINTSGPRLTWTYPIGVCPIMIAWSDFGAATFWAYPTSESFDISDPSNTSFRMSEQNDFYKRMPSLPPFYLWGVSGVSSSYTKAQLATVPSTYISTDFQGIVEVFKGAALGTGHVIDHFLIFDPCHSFIGISSYTLERSTDQVNWTVLSNTIPSTATSYVDNTVPNPTLYYRLTGITTDGGTLPYNVVSMTQPYTLSGTHNANGRNDLTWVRVLTPAIPVVTSVRASFTYNIDYIGTSSFVTFTNTSTAAGEQSLIYNWYFGDGTTSLSANSASHYYIGSTNVTASLQVTGSSGLSSSYTASFNADPFLNNLSLI